MSEKIRRGREAEGKKGRREGKKGRKGYEVELTADNTGSPLTMSCTAGFFLAKSPN
jgi:hypothetical protein